MKNDIIKPNPDRNAGSTVTSLSSCTIRIIVVHDWIIVRQDGNWNNMADSEFQRCRDS